MCWFLARGFGMKAFWRSGSSKRLSGQMIFEFIVAAVIFFGIVLYIISYLSTSMGLFSADFYTSSLQSKAVQVSEALAKNPPPVGLAKAWPVLGDAEMEELGSLCLNVNDYQGLVRRLGLFEEYGETTRYYNLKVDISKAGGEPLVKCINPALAEVMAAQRGDVRRYALSEANEILVMDVVVW